MKTRTEKEIYEAVQTATRQHGGCGIGELVLRELGINPDDFKPKRWLIQVKECQPASSYLLSLKAGKQVYLEADNAYVEVVEVERLRIE